MVRILHSAINIDGCCFCNTILECCLMFANTKPQSQVVRLVERVDYTNYTN